MKDLTWLTAEEIQKLKEEGRLEGPKATSFTNLRRTIIDILHIPILFQYFRLGKRLERELMQTAERHSCNSFAVKYNLLELIEDKEPFPYTFEFYRVHKQ